MKKTTSVIYICIFFLLLLVPLALTNLEPYVVSEIDNRELAEAPAFGKTGFTDGLESYLQDRIGLRNEMVNGYARIVDLAAGELVHPLYSYGKDGYVFFKFHEHLVFEEFHRVFAQMVLKMQEYCEARGTKFYFMFEPEKASVLRRYMPDGYQYDDSWVDQMLGYMEELGVHVISNKEFLTELSYTEDVFNRQYDAGHWNDTGCFYATNHLLNRIHEDIPVVTELNKEEFEITWHVEDHLTVSEIPIHEEVPSYRLLSAYEDVSLDYTFEIDRSEEYGFFHYMVNQADRAFDLPVLLSFQGSYYNTRPQYLVSRTSDYIAVHNYQNVMNLDYYYNLFQPDIVLFEVAEYTLGDTYFDLQAMQEMDLNPALTAEEILQAEEEKIPAEQELCLLRNAATDKAFINLGYASDGYQYLIAGGKVYDLQPNLDGCLYTVLPHDAVRDGEEVLLYRVDKNGAHSCNSAVARTGRKYSEELTSSPGTTIEIDKGRDRYIMRTDLAGNRFYGIEVQLLDDATGKILETVFSGNEAGFYHGIVTSTWPDGQYRVRLKGNTSLQDEAVECVVDLKEGESCYYSFVLVELNEQSLVAESYCVCKIPGNAASADGP